MLDALRRLVDLQKLDEELNGLEQEAAKLPERRERLEQHQTAAQEKVDASREAAQAAEADQRRAEGELQDQEAVLQRLEGQQHQVKSNEAYAALLQEMEQAKQAISGFETRILEAMEVIEASRGKLSAAEGQVTEIEARAREELVEIDAREKELGTEVSRVRGLRDGVLPEIDAKLLAQYEKIAKRRQPAVVLVSKEMCVGCRVDIPPQTYLEVRRGERLITCGNCHRILLEEAAVSAAS